MKRKCLTNLYKIDIVVKKKLCTAESILKIKRKLLETKRIFVNNNN